ncbi:bacterio-opsin activator domain-containing protein [Haloparvum sp. PAK95]|uniref:bacterio-opsin activator domain-containing protein n=1 Tax=Haloparvum sp. PAK95 TaxID=3418962 RepID=UPI003D2F30E7
MDSVVELEFEMRGTDFLLVRASEEASCELRLEELRQRSDGSVLEFVTVRGADPDRVLELVEEADELRDGRILDRDGDTALFEVVSESAVPTALADNETRFTNITAKAGEGRLVAEVPSHVDASTVIESFLEQYPDAELVARRKTDREAPTLTANRFRDDVLSDLTDRQLQALRTAYASGYFDWPREATTDAIADELDIASSTFSQHLRVAERKLLDSLFEDPSRR